MNEKEQEKKEKEKKKVNMKKLLGYGALATVTTPVWLPIAWLGYLGFRTGKRATSVAFRYPERTAIGLVLAGALTYAGCQYRDDIGSLARQAASAPVVQLYKSRARSLEEEIVRLEQENDVLASEPTVELAEAPEERTVPELREPGLLYYYVKPGDTLSGISRKVSGTPSNYRTIMRRNGIRDPRRMPAGLLLRLPEGLCTQYADSVYTSVPDLDSVLLERRHAISDAFPEHWEEVLVLNRSLGLPYGNRTRLEERVVHYQEELHRLER